MATNVTYNGTVYRVPAYQDTGYAQGSGNLSSYLIALATGSLTLSGGSFPLTADADFGANFGLKSIYYKSRAANPSSAGIIRMGNTETFGWRDNANANNILIACNATQMGGATYTIPDTGQAAANFVMTQGAQTIVGIKTFSNTPVLSSGQYYLGTGNQALVSLAALSAGRNYTIPDAGADAAFVMTKGTQTISSALTVSAVLTLSNGTVSAPAVNLGDAATGLYRGATNTVDVALNGVQGATFQSSGTADDSDYVPLVVYGAAGSDRGFYIRTYTTTGLTNASKTVGQTGDLGYAGYAFIHGSDGAGNDFMDLVAVTGDNNIAAVAKASFSARGTPAARTYNVGGSVGKINMQMASGTYTIKTLVISMPTR